MALFECRHSEWHADDDWCEITAYDIIAAATAYAKLLDDSDSEAFEHPDMTQTVLVRHKGASDHQTFVISFDYYKSFTARRELEPPT